MKQPNIIPKDLEFDIKSLSEESLNMYSHLAGIIFWIISAPFIFYKIYQIENSIITIGLLVYVFSFLMIFTSSSLYHNSYIAKNRLRFRTFDHISIYCFIAGTYTPVILIYINNDFGLMVLGGLWLTTLVGTIYKIFFIGKFRIISTIIYLLMGWAAVFIVNIISETMPTNVFYWFVSGGLVYTLGTFFYIKRNIQNNHFIWHIMVLIGAICHFIGIYLSI